MSTYPFYSANSHLEMFYGIDLTDGDFENIAIHGWDKIGNKRTRLYVLKADVVDGQLDLPCNVDIIEAVSSSTLDYQMTDNVFRENYTHDIAESYIEGRKSNLSPLYVPGKLLNYERVGDSLYFKSNFYGPVNVLYKGVILDEEGLPELSYKEVEALAAYCAFVETRKKAMSTRDKGTLEISMMLEQEWNRKCSNARTPEYLNQNDWDTIAEARHTWDRKRYGVSFKPFKN